MASVASAKVVHRGKKLLAGTVADLRKVVVSEEEEVPLVVLADLSHLQEPLQILEVVSLLET